MRTTPLLFALLAATLSAGCAAIATDGSVTVHVLNERPTPLNVTVTVDGEFVYRAALAPYDTRGDIRASDHIPLGENGSRVEVRVDGTNESEETTIDGRGGHLVVIVGPERIRFTVQDNRPVFA